MLAKNTEDSKMVLRMAKKLFAMWILSVKINTTQKVVAKKKEKRMGGERQFFFAKTKNTHTHKGKGSHLAERSREMNSTPNNTSRQGVA